LGSSARKDRSVARGAGIARVHARLHEVSAVAR
jgi:hypothetical protein